MLSKTSEVCMDLWSAAQSTRVPWLSHNEGMRQIVHRIPSSGKGEERNGMIRQSSYLTL